MSAEVDYVLEAIGANWPGGGFADVPLTRIDRDDSEFFESGLRSRTSELKESNYVGASLKGRNPKPAGFSYEHRLNTVVPVTIVGMHCSEWGHVDPDGAEGIPWEDLVRGVTDAVLTERDYPPIDRARTTYHTTFLENDVDRSDDHANFYEYHFDLRFRGYETLP